MRLGRTLSGLAVGALAFGSPVPARAAGESYRGGCRFMTTNDVLPGQWGGNDQWHADAYLLVAPRDGSGLPASATVSCELRVNGWSKGTVLGPASGTGLVAAAGEFYFSAAIDDVIEMCTHVTIGATALVDCAVAETTPLVPPAAVEAVNAAIDLLNEAVFYPVDAVICPYLAGLAPGVPPVLYVDPTGDTYVGGDYPEDLVWDCPPYP